MKIGFVLGDSDCRTADVCIRTFKKNVLNPLILDGNTVSLYISSFSDKKWEHLLHKYAIDGYVIKTETPDKNNTAFKFIDWYNVDRIFTQYNHIFSAYNNIAKNRDDDVLVKFRLDYVFYSNLDLNLINTLQNEIYVPAIEHYRDHEFDSSKICNDQIAYGKKEIMDIYFKLMSDYELPNNIPAPRSPEELLKQWLSFNSIDIQKVNFLYRKPKIDGWY